MPDKEELDKSRLEPIGQSDVKLFTTRKVFLNTSHVSNCSTGRIYPGEPDHGCDGLGVQGQDHRTGGAVQDGCAPLWGNKVLDSQKGTIGEFFRANLSAGTVTLGGLMSVLTFEHSFDTAQVKGKVLKEVFEHSASQWEEGNGGFLQV